MSSAATAFLVAALVCTWLDDKLTLAAGFAYAGARLIKNRVQLGVWDIRPTMDVADEILMEATHARQQ